MRSEYRLGWLLFRASWRIWLVWFLARLSIRCKEASERLDRCPACGLPRHAYNGRETCRSLHLDDDGGA